VIDDHIRHDIDVAGDRFYISPPAQPGIDPRVVDRIKSRIGAVDAHKER